MVSAKHASHPRLLSTVEDFCAIEPMVGVYKADSGEAKREQLMTTLIVDNFKVIEWLGWQNETPMAMARSCD